MSQAPRPAPPPARVVLPGRYARLEPVIPAHAEDLFAAASVPDAAQRFTWLFSHPPETIEVTRAWIASAQGPDTIPFAVVDLATGKAGGWQQLMRIEPQHGVVEIGNVYWGPAIARTRIATEALYLLARYVFDELGYRRFEWKCNNENAPSKAAALRFGFTFEGVFRQHMIIKGRSRDTAWFAILDGDWPALRAEFERWLDPANFDADGNQRSRLAHLTPGR